MTHYEFSQSDNDWITSDITADWLINHFDPATRVKANSKKRALFIDGHSSHYTKCFLDTAKERNITVLGDSHCTHALQGLDVTCFGITKEQFNLKLDHFVELHMRSVSKDDFAGVFRRAYLYLISAR